MEPRQPDTPVASRITAVTVFRSAALVTREAELVPVDGAWPATVRVAGLPLCLDDGSLRVRVVGDGLVVADVRVVLDVPPCDPGLPPPRDEELRAALGLVTNLEDRVAQEEGSRARLERLAPPPRPTGAPGEAPPEAPVEGRLALLELRRVELEAAAERLRALGRELVRARESVAALQERRRRASTARQAREHELRKSAVVRLEADGAVAPAGACTLAVEYLVPGPRWTPAYTLRFDPGFAQVDLGMRALVGQASGEDWTGVVLTVSTADPSRWTELPELPALRIGRRQGAPARSGWREPPSGAAELYADFDRARARTEPAAPTTKVAPPEPPAVEPAPLDLEVDKMMQDLVSPEPLAAGFTEAEEDDGRPAPPPPCPSAAPRAFFARADKVRTRASVAPGAGRADGFLGGEPEGAAAPEPEGALAAPAELLRYADLRLGGPEERERGVLRPLGASETYLELLAAMHVEVRFDVVAVLRAAVGRALAPAAVPLPPGHAAAEPWEGFDQAYRAEAAVDVAADGELHGVPLLARRASCALRHVAVPRESEQVFRFVSVANPLAAALPAGPADVYVGPSFLLSSRVGVVAPGGAAEVGLGVDETVRVARNARFAEQSGGLLGGSLELRHEVSVDVENLASREVVVEVRERVPVARGGDREVTVEDVEATPPWEVFRQADHPVEGGHRWVVTVAPGVKRELRSSYTVKIPAKKELVGGNRREP